MPATGTRTSSSVTSGSSAATAPLGRRGAVAAATLAVAVPAAAPAAPAVAVLVVVVAGTAARTAARTAAGPAVLVGGLLAVTGLGVTGLAVAAWVVALAAVTGLPRAGRHGLAVALAALAPGPVAVGADAVGRRLSGVRRRLGGSLPSQPRRPAGQVPGPGLPAAGRRRRAAAPLRLLGLARGGRPGGSAGAAAAAGGGCCRRRPAARRGAPSAVAAPFGRAGARAPVLVRRDGCDQIGLAHPSRAADAELGGDRLQLGQAQRREIDGARTRSGGFHRRDL